MLHMPVVLQCSDMAFGTDGQSPSTQQSCMLRQVPLQLLKPPLHMYVHIPPMHRAVELAYCGQSLPAQQSLSGMQEPLQSCEPGSQFPWLCERSAPRRSMPERSLFGPDATDMSPFAASGTGRAHPAAKMSGKNRLRPRTHLHGT